MRLNLILALVAGGLTLAGCKKKDPDPAPAAAADSACATDHVVPTPTDAADPKRSDNNATSSIARS